MKNTKLTRTRRWNNDRTFAKQITPNSRRWSESRASADAQTCLASLSPGWIWLAWPKMMMPVAWFRRDWAPPLPVHSRCGQKTGEKNKQRRSARNHTQRESSATLPLEWHVVCGLVLDELYSKYFHKNTLANKMYQNVRCRIYANFTLKYIVVNAILKAIFWEKTPRVNFQIEIPQWLSLADVWLQTFWKRNDEKKIQVFWSTM